MAELPASTHTRDEQFVYRQESVMPIRDHDLENLLHQHFKDAETIPELRERLRDIEEELHSVFAHELERFIKNGDASKDD